MQATSVPVFRQFSKWASQAHLQTYKNQQLFYNQQTPVTRYNLRTVYSLKQSKTKSKISRNKFNMKCVGPI